MEVTVGETPSLVSQKTQICRKSKASHQRKEYKRIRKALHKYGILCVRPSVCFRRPSVVFFCAFHSTILHSTIFRFSFWRVVLRKLSYRTIRFDHRIALQWERLSISTFYCRLLNPENRETGQKLGIATGCMFTLPFIAFYVAMLVFADKQNPENWAGAAAIITTNLVVGSYCYVAYIEDMDKNDEDGPKTGASKQRVD